MSDIITMPHEDAKRDEEFASEGNGKGGIDHAMALLAGLGHDAQRAIGSSIKYAANRAEVHAASAIRKEYHLTSKNFKEYTWQRKHYVTQGGSTTVNVYFRGHHIPLIKFDTTVERDGRVSARVKRTSSKQVLDHVFTQAVGSHYGIYERATVKRYPILEKVGPATPQMMYSNAEVYEEMDTRIEEAFNKRLPHEINAILNGWRKDGKER